MRFKMPLRGRTVFADAVKGEMAVDNAELDDFIILRADGMPTYNLAAAADEVSAAANSPGFMVSADSAEPLGPVCGNCHRTYRQR